MKYLIISIFCLIICGYASHYDMTFKRIGNKPNGYYFIYIIDNTLTAQLYLSQMDDKRGCFEKL